MVLDEINFDSSAEWFCIEGSSQELPKRMFNRIEEKKKGRISFGKRVTKIENFLVSEEEEQHLTDATFAVHVKGKDRSRVYDTVFNSAPLGSMQRMHLEGLNLNWGTNQAIRALGYGASCKVGIQFTEMTRLGITKGGVSKTDLPIRMCVYPSYNMHDNDPDHAGGEPKNVPGVLLCSYSWSQDAQRMGALIDRRSPENEGELKLLLIDNLARLHAAPEKGWPYEKLYKLINDTYQTHYAYDWYQDDGTPAAFAYFGPGQFRKMFPYIVRNDGHHIIIGEAPCLHHAWVVGAVEYALRGVYQFLYKHSKTSAVCNRILRDYNNWDSDPEAKERLPEPFGPIPKEFDQTKDVKPLVGRVDKKQTDLVNGNGEWLRQGVQIEDWRLKQGGDLSDPSNVTRDDLDEFKVLQA